MVWDQRASGSMEKSGWGDQSEKKGKRDKRRGK